MCGIVGIFSTPGRVPSGQHRDNVALMCGHLAHRGPDGHGVWQDPVAPVVLGHTRLSVIDLSQMAHQPMTSPCGRYTLTFNGEIYNFQDLRTELEKIGHSFRGHSDTEVIIHAISQWGLIESIKQLCGMFAFALWDGRDKTLTLVRDRLGIKPIYYGFAGLETFAFASELRPFLVLRDFCKDVDRVALDQFVKHGYVSGPRTIFKSVRKLEPGSMITVRLAENSSVIKTESSRYWDVDETFQEGVKSPFQGSREDAIVELESLFGTVIRQHMISDVPLGAFLSGGIDSSLVVALMQRHSPKPVRTFTIGFSETDYDESHSARDVARFLGTEHTEVIFDETTLLGIVPRLPDIYDEPFADESQIPTVLVCELARQRVTVALSGDGGDEFFAGYDRYRTIARAWGRVSSMPGWVNAMAAFLCRTGAPAAEILRGIRFADQLIPQALRENTGHRMRKIARLIEQKTVEDFYRVWVSALGDEDSLVFPDSGEAATCIAQMSSPGEIDLLSRLAIIDIRSALHDDMLTKVDRASMAVSHEVRVPLLDHRIVEFAARVPTRWKSSDREGKLLLRELLYRHVPRHLVDRPKQGFGVPIGHWLRGPLREWATALLQSSKLTDDNLLDWARIERKWQQHIQGTHNWGKLLWNVLMFLAWKERHLKSNYASASGTEVVGDRA